MVTTSDIRTIVNPYNMNRQFAPAIQTVAREVLWTDITEYDFTYEIIDIPARSMVLNVFMVVTTAFAGSSTTITCGTNDGTENDVDRYWNTTTGAEANFAIRSIVGCYGCRDFTDTAADFEAKLIYDTAAKHITLTVGTADLTAGEGILVAQYMEFPKVSR